VRISLGESQDWSWAASGCALRSFFVRPLYVIKALLIISWKLEEDDEEDDETAVG
jgi:hypothetical protein